MRRVGSENLFDKWSRLVVHPLILKEASITSLVVQIVGLLFSKPFVQPDTSSSSPVYLLIMMKTEQFICRWFHLS